MENAGLDESKYRAIRQWFQAAEVLGDFIGIRFGYLPRSTSEPQWIFYPHTDYDGIGAFADILRRQGAELKQLPQIKYYPAYSAIVAALKHWPRYALPRRQLSWLPLDRDGSTSNPQRPPKAVAWHVFDEETSLQIRLESRKSGVTVNTLLLKSLTEALRPYFEPTQGGMPWMLPVNMRGGVNQFRDTDNHTSYVAIRVLPGEPALNIHHRILKALSRGEHWGNWHACRLGRCITGRARIYLVSRGLCLSQWSVGAFSNLGEWDPDKRISATGAIGDWLFCPPALRTQMVGAGCITYQGRLSLTIQAHPELTTSISVVRRWIQKWVSEISEAISSSGATDHSVSLREGMGLNSAMPSFPEDGRGELQQGEAAASGNCFHR